MAPVALPTVVAHGDELEAGEDSPLRLRAQMGADGDAEAETERPL